MHSLSYDLKNTSRGSREALEASLARLWRFLVHILDDFWCISWTFFHISLSIYIYIYTLLLPRLLLQKGRDWGPHGPPWGFTSLFFVEEEEEAEEVYVYIYICIVQARYLVHSLSYDLGSLSRDLRDSLEACFACLWRILVHIFDVFFYIFDDFSSGGAD